MIARKTFGIGPTTQVLLAGGARSNNTTWSRTGNKSFRDIQLANTKVILFFLLLFSHWSTSICCCCCCCCQPCCCTLLGNQDGMMSRRTRSILSTLQLVSCACPSLTEQTYFRSTTAALKSIFGRVDFRCC